MFSCFAAVSSARMPNWAPLAGTAIAGYALGSVSFALLFARARGVDLRAVGSGNLGATNVGRALGRGYGISVYLLDALKGWLPVFLAPLLLGGNDADDDVLLAVTAGAAAFVGHIWPAWLGFRGGKGVATLSGALLALHPWTLVTAGAVHFLIASTTRVMALASLGFGLALPIAAWAYGAPTPVVVFAALAAPLLFYTHRSNLRRIFRGAEDKLGGPLENES